MIDSLVEHSEKAKKTTILDDMKLEKDNYVLITLHRPSNVDNINGLDTIISAFEEISKKIKLIFPIHPRAKKQIEVFGMKERVDNIKNLTLLPPIGDDDFMRLQMDAKFILTDSGGIQEESTFLGVPCLTLRPNTERPITITEGTNKLVKLDTESIINEANTILAGTNKSGKIPEKWDGKTAERIVEIFRAEVL